MVAKGESSTQRMLDFDEKNGAVKLTDYLVEGLVRHGSDHAFGMSGGAAVHLFDSASKHSKMNTTFVTHEQSASIAADCFTRVSGRSGVAFVTSGPGATNLLTGTCCSYYDSIPSIMITGQVATNRLRGAIPIRQFGFQETDVLSIFESVTKYAAQILDPEELCEVLKKAYSEAHASRQGPVLIDIPDDIQRAETNLEPPSPATQTATSLTTTALETLEEILATLNRSLRPVIIIGGGIRTPDCSHLARQFLELTQSPVLRTWAALDILPDNWPRQYGTFGVYGPRLGNHIVENADFILCIGTRLSQNVSGSKMANFASDAKLAIVDIDDGELAKFGAHGRNVDFALQLSAAEFFEHSLGLFQNVVDGEQSSLWLKSIESTKAICEQFDAGYRMANGTKINANSFVRTLSKYLADDEIVIIDTGANLTWACNSLETKNMQRVISAWNFTPMGYALPASIGAASASNRPISCIIGDGGLQLCLGELATVAQYNLPLKIFLFNNHGHAIQKQTLETWLGGAYVGVDRESGLGLSDLPRVVHAMGIQVITIESNQEITSKLRQVFRASGPILCSVEIDPDQRLLPFLKSGQRLSQQTPELPSQTAMEIRHHLQN
jgi:acetolactate synthase-1/2/3 large subunit